MTSHEVFNKALICTVLLTFTLGCTTTQTLTTTSPQALVDSVAVGDKVKIAKKDGTRLALKVTEVSTDGISGSGTFIPYADIQQVSADSENRVGTILLVALGVGLLYVMEKNLDCGIFPLGAECPD